MATRRDLQDEETAVFCARRIQSEKHLTLLYLLTVADSMSTGPKAWNEWTASLLQSLYEKTLTVLRKDEFAPDLAIETIESKKKALKQRALARGLDGRTIERNENLMSLRYLLNMDVPDIEDHIDLYSRLGDKPFVWNIVGEGPTATRTVTVAAKNKPGLFSKIAGVLTLFGFNIFNAQIYTWKNNVAIDIFDVSPPVDLLFESDKWKKAEQELQDVLIHDINLRVRINDLVRWKKQDKFFTVKKPTRVDIDNETSGYFTIIDVHTYDFPGLLFCITDTLFRFGLDIYVSKIATSLDQVVDIFYVRNMYGEKVNTPEQIETIKAGILKAIETFTP
jgi:[protein-PII] uridylyltransferase